MIGLVDHFGGLCLGLIEIREDWYKVSLGPG